MNPTVQISYRDGRRQAIPLAGTEAIIGRDASCDVTLDDSITSRRHARLYRDPAGAYWIQDLRSKNGTIVNQRAITAPVRLHEGDQIEIGDCTLCLAPLSRAAAGPVLVNDPNLETTLGAASTWGAQQQLELSQKRLQTLYDLNTRLTGRFDRNDLLGEVLDICIEAFRFERAGVAVWRGAPHPPEWIVMRDARGGPPGEFRISRSLVDDALHNARRGIRDAADAAVDPTASMVSNNIRSAMCVPMEYHQTVHGVLYGDRVTSTGGYTREDIDYFAALGRLGAMGLANAQLVEEMKARQQVELQLQWARQIQTNLFPAEPLALDALTIDALNDPGQKVSGDYYDYFPRPDGLIAVVVADVCGKGAPAALLMANFQAAVHVTLAQESDLLRAAELLNRLVCRNVKDSRFITGIVGLLNPAQRTFTYVNAGHPPPVVWHGSGSAAPHKEADSALPFGIEPDFPYALNVVQLGRPGSLFMYTDGAPDAEDPRGDKFGDDSLLETIAAAASLPPGEMLARTRRAVSQFTRNHPLVDDITLLAARLE